MCLNKKLETINTDLPTLGTIDSKTKDGYYALSLGGKQYQQEKIDILEEKAKQLNIRNEILSAYKDSLQNEAELRKKWAMKIFCFAAAYIVAVLVITIANHYVGIEISNNVLMVLVGSTSVNIVGLITVMMRFIFTHHHHKILDSNKK